ncbi:hypothetical protein IKG60_02200 [Candidatus Saccharibacteria bacterium]|nr:hypothetical protein [Candidatus Saccharibacteria bacterium]
MRAYIKYYQILTITISLIVIGISANLSPHSASAVTYQDTIDQSFTLNPTITLSLTGGNLSIDNLTPGYSSDSNIVTVNVSTNAGYGYYLSATAGTPSTNTDLTHTTATTNTFTNLTSNKPTLSDFSDNTWGYSYCNSTNDCTNNANWVSGDLGNTSTGYNGLPLDQNNNGSTGIKLLNPTTIASSGSIQFKIGAKASTTQVAGTYTGTINFYAVTNPNLPTLADVTYMQDVTSDMVANTAEEMTFTLKDKRDEQEYTVAKLKDGKLWMTSNLNLAGGTALDATNTDVTSDYIAGFTTGGGLTKTGNTIVLPVSATITSGTSLSSDQFSDNSTAYVFNSGNNTADCTSDKPCNSYYYWIAATLGGKQSNGGTAVENYHNAAASICPKGWRLPTSTTSNADARIDSNWKTGDWYALATAYGANLENNYYDDSIMTRANFYSQAGPNSDVPRFLSAGRYLTSSLFEHGGSFGFYWSSTLSSDASAHRLGFNSSSVYSATVDYRRHGNSVRCLFST